MPSTDGLGLNYSEGKNTIEPPSSRGQSPPDVSQTQLVLETLLSGHCIKCCYLGSICQYY